VASTDPSTDPSTGGAEVRFLDDVRVLEIASLAPAQLAMHLADLGAEVIKIEPPMRGDATRLIAKQPGYNDSGLHRRWNRGKRSLALDTTTPEGQDVLRRLIPTVDVVIEGLRPGTLDKMGLGWDELTRLKPDLVVISLSGYGQSGPYRDLPSHGIAFDAVSGLANVEEDDAGRPRVATGHVYYGSLIAPLFGATSVLAALSWSRRNRKPVRIDVAQADVAAFINFGIEDAAAERAATAAGLVDTPALMSAGGGRSTIQAYRTRDGHLLMLMALERKFFVRLAEAIGRADLVEQVPEDQYMARTTPEIDDALASAIAAEDLVHWMEVFAAADVPVVPVNESADALDDPQLQSRTEWLRADQGTVTMKTPIHAEPAPVAPRPAPAVGSDSVAVLAELGLTDQEVAALEAAGVVRIDR
jgi:crotonobetainyl-CoA:carnitine CoA-transferase CaiB-like acyl-CoA transferase